MDVLNQTHRFEVKIPRTDTPNVCQRRVLESKTNMFLMKGTYALVKPSMGLPVFCWQFPISAPGIGWPLA